MPARRGRQARRNGGSDGLPGWIWLLGGLVLGLIFAGVVMYRLRPAEAPGPRPNPQAQAPARASEEPLAQQEAPRKPKYDFYTVLAEREVVVPDAEIDAQAKAEAAAQAKARADAQAAAARRLADAENALTRPPPAPAPVASGESYVLQAGAFRAPNEAESLKARIALIGLSARVEAAQIRGETVYRVRMGPYGSAAALAGAKDTLAGSGIPAVAIRAR